MSPPGTSKISLILKVPREHATGHPSVRADFCQGDLFSTLIDPGRHSSVHREPQHSKSPHHTPQNAQKRQRLCRLAPGLLSASPPLLPDRLEHLADSGLRIFSSVPRSPRSRSSTPSPRASARGSSNEMSGKPAPRSHLLTARSDTWRTLASSRWVKFFSLRAAAISAPVFALSISITCAHSTSPGAGPQQTLRGAPVFHASAGRPVLEAAPQDGDHPLHAAGQVLAPVAHQEVGPPEGAALHLQLPEGAAGQIRLHQRPGQQRDAQPRPGAGQQAGGADALHHRCGRGPQPLELRIHAVPGAAAPLPQQQALLRQLRQRQALPPRKVPRRAHRRQILAAQGSTR